MSLGARLFSRAKVSAQERHVSSSGRKPPSLCALCRQEQGRVAL